MVARMCNLYSTRRSRDEIAAIFRAQPWQGPAGPWEELYPDMLAPTIRLDVDGDRALLDMRWGFPPPSLGSRPVTNVRNLKSPYWRGWLKPEWRCLAPATSFCEWTDARPKAKRWFAPPDGEPFAFAGLWRPWTGARGAKSSPVEGEHLVFAILTTEANDVVRPVHAKAMPVILSDEAAWDAWLTGSLEQAVAMQRPASLEALRMLDDGGDPA
jgi:putative SOS response-associated peptidase YedK